MDYFQLQHVAALRWKKFKKLGSGSYGTVYLAGDEIDYFFRSGSFAAVKTSDDFYHSRTLIKETKFLKELRGNPFVVQCFAEDISMEGGKPVFNLLMEYAPCGTLHDLIHAPNFNTGNLQESHIAIYSYMLLKGISSAHNKGIVHCDLKPGNILLFPSNRKGLFYLKLADFGLSKYVWEEDAVRSDGKYRHRGTRVYAPPESIASGLHGKATDVWSFGCTVLEMMTGRQCRTDQEMWNLFDEFVLMPSQHISKLGQDFLCKCLEPYHSERWTVDMLLDHPFIVLNLKGLVPLIEELIQCRTQSNPFGVRDQWIVTQGLFSTREYNPPHQIFPAAIEGNSQALRKNIEGHSGGIKIEERQGMIKN